MKREKICVNCKRTIKRILNEIIALNDYEIECSNEFYSFRCKKCEKTFSVAYKITKRD